MRRPEPGNWRFRLAVVALGTAVMTGLVAACGTAGGGEYRAAAERVIQEVVQPDGLDHPVIVFGMDESLDSGDSLVPYSKEGYPIQPEVYPIDEPTWFFWIDDAPGALYVHPTRFVFVRQSDGRVTVQEADWWPVLNGSGLWISEADYWNPENWVYSNLDRPSAAGSLRATTGRLAAPALRATRQEGGRAVGIVLNGWKPDEKLEEMFEIDSNAVHDMLTGDGFDVTYFGPEQDTNPDRDGAFDPGNWAPWFVDRSRELKDGDTLFVYLTGHGFEGGRGNGFAGSMGEDTLVTQLRRFDPGVHIIVVVQSCHSGAFLDGLRTVADVSVVSTSNLDPAYNDVDTGQFRQIEETDPNDDDVGSEFVSGLVEDWNQIRADPAARQQAQDRADREGTNLWEETTALAYLSAVEKDVTAQAGWSFPNLVRGDASTRPPPKKVSYADPAQDGLVCSSGAPLGTNTSPGADLTGARVELLDPELTGGVPTVQFTMELGLVDGPQGTLFGGVEFFDPSRANSLPNPQWVFDGIGNQNFSFSYNGKAYFPMLHTFVEGDGWSTTRDPGFDVSNEGNAILIDIPASMIPPDSRFYFSITDISSCDAIGLDADGRAELELPFPLR